MSLVEQLIAKARELDSEATPMSQAKVMAYISESRSLLLQLADALELQQLHLNTVRAAKALIVDEREAARREAHGFDLVNSMLLDENRGLRQENERLRHLDDDYGKLYAEYTNLINRCTCYARTTTPVACKHERYTEAPNGRVRQCSDCFKTSSLGRDGWHDYR